VARAGDKILAGSSDDFRWRPQGIFAMEQARQKEMEENNEDHSKVMAEIPEVEDDRDDDAGDIIQSEQEAPTAPAPTPAEPETVTPAPIAPVETPQPSEQKDSTVQDPEIDAPNP